MIIDISAERQKKRLKLAKANNVAIDYQLGELQLQHSITGNLMQLRSFNVHAVLGNIIMWSVK